MPIPTWNHDANQGVALFRNLFLACIACSMIGLINTAAAQSTRQWADPLHGFLLHHPADWQTRRLGGPTDIVELQSDGHGAALRVALHPLTHTEPDFTQHFQAQFMAQQHARLVARREGTHGAYRQVEWVMHAQRGEQITVLRCRLLFLPERQQVLVLQSGYLAAAQDRWQPVVDAILDSVWIYPLAALPGSDRAP